MVTEYTSKVMQRADSGGNELHCGRRKRQAKCQTSELQTVEDAAPGTAPPCSSRHCAQASTRARYLTISRGGGATGASTADIASRRGSHGVPPEIFARGPTTLTVRPRESEGGTP